VQENQYGGEVSSRQMISLDFNLITTVTFRVSHVTRVAARGRGGGERDN